MAGMGVLCVPLAMLLVFGCLGCATPCVQALAEESSTDSKFTNVKAGVEVLKRFVQTRCWRIPDESRATAEELKIMLAGIARMENYLAIIQNMPEQPQSNNSRPNTLSLLSTIMQQVVGDAYRWLNTFEPSIPAASCNIPPSLHFDPLAAGLAVNLFDSVNNTSHILEQYRGGSVDIAAWINRAIPEQELQCDLCELTCGISCGNNCTIL